MWMGTRAHLTCMKGRTLLLRAVLHLLIAVGLHDAAVALARYERGAGQ